MTQVGWLLQNWTEQDRRSERQAEPMVPGFVSQSQPVLLLH